MKFCEYCDEKPARTCLGPQGNRLREKTCSDVCETALRAENNAFTTRMRFETWTGWEWNRRQVDEGERVPSMRNSCDALLEHILLFGDEDQETAVQRMQSEFLAAYQRFHNISKSARVVGMARSTHAEMIKRDTGYAAKFRVMSAAA